MPSKAESLARLRALRAAGKTSFDTYEVQEAESIYETVDDEGYKKVVRSRLDQDDFVVDDNGEGYADDGREDWQDERQAYDESESENDLPRQGKAGECAKLGSRGCKALIEVKPNASEKKMLNDKRRSTRASANTSIRRPQLPHQRPSQSERPRMTCSWQIYLEKSTPTSKPVLPHTASL